MTESDAQYERQAHLECLEIVYRQVSTAVPAHLAAAALVGWVMVDRVALQRIVIWWMLLAAIGITRVVGTRRYLAQHPSDALEVDRWTGALTLLATAQTLVWGLAAFFMWPAETEYRAFIVVSLAGVIAAGGIMLAIHRRSFIIYCVPVAVPVTWQLFSSDGKIETALGIMFVLYSLLLFSAVSRLERNFRAGIVLRLKMQTLSRVDPLTELANRRGFDEYLKDSWQNLARSNQSIGLILVDVDHFKSYNDEYGHPQGDVALQALASVFRDSISRGTDLCARVGGEEFAFVLPSTDLEGTRKIAEAVQRTLSERAIAHSHSDTGVVTVSMGLNVVVPSADQTIADFYEAADKALYRAKELGRNRIESVPGIASARTESKTESETREEKSDEN